MSHDEAVDAWLSRVTPASSAGLLEAFERAVRGLWSRTEVTLGGVTLSAIVERVVHDAAERHPLFGTLRVDIGGVLFDELVRRASMHPDDELRSGVRFVLLQFLSVIGNLTAEVLTDQLHRELLETAAEPAAEQTARTGSSLGKGGTKVSS